MRKFWIVIQGIGWILLYLFLTLIPLFVMLLEPRPAGREFWRELSVALGFAGLAMMTLQFALTARFKILKAPYGSDIVYYFHRNISIVAFLLVLTHPLLLFIFDPETLGLLNLVSAPWRARAAVVSLLSLTGMVFVSIWRKQLRYEYNKWRIWHGLLASSAVTLALVHITLVNHYLNSPWKRVLWGGYAIFFLGMLLYTRLIKPFMLMRKPYLVSEVKPELGGATTLVLEPDGHPGFRFKPGQFAWLTAWGTPFEDKEHPFSISSSAEHPEKISFTIKSLGDFTETVAKMHSGQKVFVDGAYGSFSVDQHAHAEGFVFIAGGVGITPMMSTLRTLADRGETRPLWLIYANRDWDSLTFREEIASLGEQLNLSITCVLEKPPEGWSGESGFITREMLERILPAERRKNLLEIFICGPAPMMDAVENALTAMGFFAGDIHSERFDMV